ATAEGDGFEQSVRYMRPQSLRLHRSTFWQFSFPGGPTVRSLLGPREEPLITSASSWKATSTQHGDTSTQNHSSHSRRQSLRAAVRDLPPFLWSGGLRTGSGTRILHRQPYALAGRRHVETLDPERRERLD